MAIGVFVVSACIYWIAVSVLRLVGGGECLDLKFEDKLLLLFAYVFMVLVEDDNRESVTARIRQEFVEVRLKIFLLFYLLAEVSGKDESRLSL